MSKKDVHVVPHPEGWAVKREGAERASSVHERKVDAEAAGRDLARKDEVELVIHGKDGRIQDSDSYGNDRVRRGTRSIDQDKARALRRPQLFERPQLHHNEGTWIHDTVVRNRFRGTAELAT